MEETAIGIGSVHSTLYSPVFVDIIVSRFFAKIGLCKQLCTENGAFAAQELAIHIELADVIKIQTGHILTWAESNQAITQQVIVAFKIGTVDIVTVLQLIGFVGQVRQQAQFNSSVVTDQPVVGVEHCCGLHNVSSRPIGTFVLDNLSFGIGSVGIPLLDVVLIENKALCINIAVPLSGVGSNQSQSTLSSTCDGLIDQITKRTGVVQHNHVFI